MEILPLNWSDLNTFDKWLKHHKKRGAMFFFNQITSNEKLWSWYKDDYLQPIDKEDINQWLIFWFNGKRIGAANYNGCNLECEVLIFMAPRWKNKGLGSIFLFLSEKWMRKKYPKLDAVWADIEYNNIASIKTFRGLGYKKIPGGDYYKYL